MASASSEGQLHGRAKGGDTGPTRSRCTRGYCDLRRRHRAALRASLVANSFVAAEVERLSNAVSFGFTRGKISPSRGASEKLTSGANSLLVSFQNPATILNDMLFHAFYRDHTSRS